LTAPVKPPILDRGFPGTYTVEVKIPVNGEKTAREE